MRLIPRVFILGLVFMLFISYQNFSSMAPGDWDSTSSLKIINEMNAFQATDRGVPQKLATPQGGSDFQSVRNDWMQRQGTILLNGYDKKLEAAMNEKLNTWVHEITRKDPVDEPANSSQATKAVSETQPGSQGNSEEPKKTKQFLRFSRINSLKYELGENTCMNFTADPGNTHFDLSQTLNSHTKMGFEHRTADGQSQMFLKYEW